MVVGFWQEAAGVSPVKNLFVLSADVRSPQKIICFGAQATKHTYINH